LCDATTAEGLPNGDFNKILKNNNKIFIDNQLVTKVRVKILALKLGKLLERGLPSPPQNIGDIQCLRDSAGVI
jgi:hypothetical protein